MSAPVWPPSLPQKPLRNGYVENINDDRLNYEMDNGSKLRASGYILPETMTCPFIMTTDQYNIFKSFVTNTLKKAVIAFDFPHPLEDRYIRVSFLPKGKGSSLWSKSYMQDSNYWQISIELQVHTDVTI